MSNVSQMRVTSQEPSTANKQTFDITVSDTIAQISLTEGGALSAIEFIEVLKALAAPRVLSDVLGADPPSPPSGKVTMYYKVSGGAPEIFMRENNGTVTQMTGAGAGSTWFNITAPSTGDILMFNGTNYVETSVISGGTF